MDLEKLMSSPERVRILQYVLVQGSVTNKLVSEGTGTNKGLVSIYLKILVDQGILSVQGRTFSVNNSAIVRALKRFLNLARLTMGDLDITWARGIGLYGSWAIGTNDVESDIDLWVLVDEIDNQKIATFRKSLSDRALSEVNISILTDEKIRSMREQDTLFYRNLMYGSVVLVGEGI